jgi:membrane protein
MNKPTAEPQGSPGESDEPRSRGLADRVRETIATGSEKARSAAEQHASVAIPFRAAERNRRVAASVLAGGAAYRLFLWLLPFGLIVGGVLGLGNANGTEDAVASGGLPQAVVDAIGDIARAGDSSSWWLLLVGVPLLLWEGYAGAKGLHLIHALVWNDPSPPRFRPLRSSLSFSGGMCVFITTVSLSWWFRDTTQASQWLIFVVMIVPLAALWLLVSLRLPHRGASWKALLPGALLVAVGFQVAHGLVLYLLGPKLEKSMSLYGALGVTTTVLFFMWVVGWIVVTAPVLNSSLYEELQRRARHEESEPTVEAGST